MNNNHGNRLPRKKKLSAVEAARRRNAREARRSGGGGGGRGGRPQIALDEAKVTEILQGLNISEEYRDRIKGFIDEHNPEAFLRDIMNDKAKQEDLMKQLQDGIGEYVDEETRQNISDDADTLIAWVKEQKAVRVYRVAKVILKILKDYIVRHDPEMFSIIKQVIPSMKTDLYALYRKHILDQGLQDNEFVGLAWTAVEQLVNMLEQFQSEFADDEAKVSEMLTQFPSYIRMLIAEGHELGMDIPEQYKTIVENVLQSLENSSYDMTSQQHGEEEGGGASSSSSSTKPNKKKKKKKDHQEEEIQT